MGGGGGPPPPSPVIVGAFIMTFAAGLLDATTMLSWAGTTSTHMSGKFLKVGVSTAQGDIKGLTPSFCMVFSFFIGAFSAGVMTATPKRKTLYTCALGMFIVGIGCCLTSILFLAAVPDAVASGYPWYKTAVVAPYVAALTSGFQNAMLTTITGFMRSTHMTGTVTDVGLLCGQAYPDKMKDKAHWWKTRILAGLIGTWSFSGLIASWLHLQAGLGDYLGFAAGGISFMVSFIAFYYLNKDAKAARKVAAEEAIAKEKAKAEADAKAKSNKSKSRLQAVTKITALRLSMGMEALQNIASEMDGNLESMPSPAAKVVFKAMNVNKMVNNLKGMSSKKLLGGGTEEAREKVLQQIGDVCEWLLSHPELVLQLEKAKGEGCGADFLAAFSAQQQAFKPEPKTEDEAATKVQAAMRGKQARAELATKGQ